MLQVSVIIPTYNRAELLSNAIESVLNQTFANFELIIVDDHSTDHTEELVRDYKDERINYLINTREKGAPGARNTGLNIAKGGFIQFLDSDDILLPQKIEKQVQLFDNGVALIVGDYKKVKPDGTERIIQAESNPWAGLIRSKLGVTSSNLFQKNILLEIKGWNESLKSSQEYELMFRILKNNGFVLHDRQVNTILNISETSVSQSTDSKRVREILETRFELRDQIRSYLQSEGLYSDEIQLCFDKYTFDQLWFNRYKHPQFFRDNMAIRTFELRWYYKIWRALKSTIRGKLEI